MEGMEMCACGKADCAAHGSDGQMCTCDHDSCNCEHCVPKREPSVA